MFLGSVESSALGLYYDFYTLQFDGNHYVDKNSCCNLLFMILKSLYADFIDTGADLPEEGGGRRMHRPPLMEQEQEDVEDLERRIQQRYARSHHTEYDEETTDVDQQALLPSVLDPKLWMVKCAV